MKTTILIMTMLGATPALAEGHGAQVAYPAEYKVECASCHVAFPPGLLNKADWDKTMQGLNKHFGTDAGLDDKTTASIANWLRQHAGARAASGTNPPRATTSAWFKREHREVAASRWKDARIKSPANYAACHTGAEQGRFGDDEIRIPGQGRPNEDD